METIQLIWLLIIITIIVIVLAMLCIKYRNQLATFISSLMPGKAIRTITGGGARELINLFNSLPNDARIYDITNLAVQFDQVAFYNGYKPCYELSIPDNQKCGECAHGGSNPFVPIPYVYNANSTDPNEKICRISVNMAYLYAMQNQQTPNIFVYKLFTTDLKVYFGPKMVPLLKYSPIPLQSRVDWKLHFDSESSKRDMADKQVLPSLIDLCLLSGYDFNTNVILGNFIDIAQTIITEIENNRISRNGRIRVGVDIDYLNQKLFGIEPHKFNTYGDIPDMNIINFGAGVPYTGVYPDFHTEIMLKLLYCHFKKSAKPDYQLYKLMWDLCSNIAVVLNSFLYGADKLSVVIVQNNNEDTRITFPMHGNINDVLDVDENKHDINNSESEFSKNNHLMMFCVEENNKKILLDLYTLEPKYIVEFKNKVFDKVSKLTNDNSGTFSFYEKKYKVNDMKTKDNIIYLTTYNVGKINTKILLSQSVKIITKLLSYINNSSLFIYTDFTSDDQTHLDFLKAMKNNNMLKKTYHWVKGYDDYVALSIYGLLLNKGSRLSSLDFYNDWPVFGIPKDPIISYEAPPERQNPFIPVSKNKPSSKQTPKTNFEINHPLRATALIKKNYTRYFNGKHTLIDNYIAQEFKNSYMKQSYSTVFKNVVPGEGIHLPEFMMEIYTFDQNKVNTIMTYTINATDDPLQDYIGVDGAYYLLDKPINPNRTFSVINAV